MASICIYFNIITHVSPLLKPFLGTWVAGFRVRLLVCIMYQYAHILLMQKLNVIDKADFLLIGDRPFRPVTWKTPLHTLCHTVSHSLIYYSVNIVCCDAS